MLRNLTKSFILPPGVSAFRSLVVRVRTQETNNAAHLYFRDGRLISNQGVGGLSPSGRFDVWVLPRNDYILQLMNRELTFTYQEFRLPPNGDVDSVPLPGGVTPALLISDDANNTLTLGSDSKLFVSRPQLSSALW